jgi:uncharacterized membrane protein
LPPSKYGPSDPPPKGTFVEITSAITVRRPVQELYAFWRRLENLPTFMIHLDEVRDLGGTKSHWRATAPFGKTVQWDAEIVDDLPGERISWRSSEGADVDNSGSVRFLPAPGDQGTEVFVEIRYTMPTKALGSAVARYFGEDPRQHLDDDLRRFKQVCETGEVVRSEGAPRGKKSREEFPQHPAQPLTAEELDEIRKEEDNRT